MKKTLILGLFALLVISSSIVPSTATISTGTLYAVAGNAGDNTVSGDYTDTFSGVDSSYDAQTEGAGIAWIVLNFTFEIPSGFGFESFDYAIHAAGGADDINSALFVYDWDGASYVELEAIGNGIASWNNDTGINDPDYCLNNETIRIRVESEEPDNPDNADVTISIALLTVYIDDRTFQDVGEAEFIFPVGWDPTFQFGYDAAFIFAGLLLLPASTIYLVRGGRKGMSSDKVFFFLVMFMMGLGLFIGGIMP